MAPDSGTLWFIADGQVHRLRPDGGGAETLTNWRTPISGHLPLAGGLRAAVVAGTSRPRRTSAGRPNATTRWSGASRDLMTGCGCSTWARVN